MSMLRFFYYIRCADRDGINFLAVIFDVLSHGGTDKVTVVFI